MPDRLPDIPGVVVFGGGYQHTRGRSRGLSDKRGIHMNRRSFLASCTALIGALFSGAWLWGWLFPPKEPVFGIRWSEHKLVTLKPEGTWHDYNLPRPADHERIAKMCEAHKKLEPWRAENRRAFQRYFDEQWARP